VIAVTTPQRAIDKDAVGLWGGHGQRPGGIDAGFGLHGLRISLVSKGASRRDAPTASRSLPTLLRCSTSVPFRNLRKLRFTELGMYRSLAFFSLVRARREGRKVIEHDAQASQV
jgi:hypothetical protein